MPPFWVTTKPPSATSAAPLAPPPVSAIVTRRPDSGQTRSSVPPRTLVHTTVPSVSPVPGGHHTGPSPNSGPAQTTCGPSMPASSPNRPHRRSGPRDTVAGGPLSSSPPAANHRSMRMTRPATLGELEPSGWESRPVKEEVRANAIARIAEGEPLVDGVLGYEDTVLPQLENALLAGHDVIFLGERGQAKTRMIRSLTDLLDEWMPIVAGSEINDDPYHPVSHARARARRRARRRHADRVGAPRPSLRREARHARHVDRRPHRRGRPDQGRRGPLPLRRAHDPLRPRAAHQPRHLRDQRAARPRRAHPGRSAQRARGARRPDPRLQDPAAARRACSSRRRTPRTTRTAAASSRRSRTASARRSARTTRSTPSSRSAIIEQEARPLAADGLAGARCPTS